MTSTVPPASLVGTNIVAVVWVFYAPMRRRKQCQHILVTNVPYRVQFSGLSSQRPVAWSTTGEAEA